MRILQLTILLSLAFVRLSGQSAIFLLHSTGGGVYTEGHVPQWISDYNTDHSTNYSITALAYPDDPYPWENYPYDYWNLWINGACNNSNNSTLCLDKLCSDYDLIIFKHCYPGAGIQPANGSPSIDSPIKTIENYKLQYRALRELLDNYPNNKFVIWTLAPLHRLATDPLTASRAKEFVDWVKNEWLTEDDKDHPNIYIFDFFTLAAETNPASEFVNCLKYQYELSHDNNDSHPNTQANETIGPLFAEFIVNVMAGNNTINISEIAISSDNNKTEITENGGTLQLTVTISPSNATNKNIEWTIENGSGEATISNNGLVTAVSDGLVTAVALAKDGSEVYDLFDIQISNQENMTTLHSHLKEKVGYSLKNSTLFLSGIDQYKLLRIYDVTGDLMLTTEILNDSFSTNLNSLQPGIYILLLSAIGHKPLTIKILKP